MQSLRIHWLLSTAILSGFALPALAQTVPGIAPSIEIHSDVIESLRQSYTAQPLVSFAPAPVSSAPMPSAPMPYAAGRQPVNAPEVVGTIVPPAAHPTPAPSPKKKPVKTPKPDKIQASDSTSVVGDQPAGLDLAPPPGVATVAPETVIPAAPSYPGTGSWSGAMPSPGTKPTAPAQPEAALPAAKPVMVKTPKAVAPKAPEPKTTEPKTPELKPLPSVSKAPKTTPTRQVPEAVATKSSMALVPPASSPAPETSAPLIELPAAPKAKPTPKPSVNNALPGPAALTPPSPVKIPEAAKPLPAPLELPPLQTPDQAKALSAPPEIKVPEKSTVPMKPPVVPQAPAQAAPSALVPPAKSPAVSIKDEGVSLIGDVKHVMRRMLGSEPENLPPIAPAPLTPEPVATAPVSTPLPPLVPVAPALPMPGLPDSAPKLPELPKAPEAPIKQGAPLIEKKATPDSKKPELNPVEPKVEAPKKMEAKAAQAPSGAPMPMELPPLPSGPASKPDIAPGLDLPPLPGDASSAHRPKDGLDDLMLPTPAIAPKVTEKKPAAPLAPLPPISMLEEPGNQKAAPVSPAQSSALASLPDAKDLPPLPSMNPTPAKEVKAKEETKPAPKAASSKATVKAIPVPEVANAELPPIMDLPPLPSEISDTPKPDAKKGKSAPIAIMTPPELPEITEAVPPAAKAAPKAASGDSILFPKDSLDLPANMDATLGKVLGTINAAPGKRVLVVAYASGKGEEQARAARKIALSRGLKVRGVLIDKGIDKLRINVQAKVDESGTASADRVEVGLE